MKNEIQIQIPSQRTWAAGVSAPYSGAGAARVSAADSVVSARAAARRSRTGTGTEAETGTTAGASASTGRAAAQSGVETLGADLGGVALVGAGMSSSSPSSLAFPFFSLAMPALVGLPPQ